MGYKSILGALAVAAGVGAAVAVKLLKDKKTNTEPDDEVHFIRIDDDEEEEEGDSDSDSEDGRSSHILKSSAYPDFDLTNKSQEVVEVCGVYPYLSPSFIESLLNRNDELNAKFANESLVTIVHTVKFNDLSSREGFETILSAGGYAVSQSGDSEATASRKIYIEEGAIISDILNVANQACALNGTYEKFDVLA